MYYWYLYHTRSSANKNTSKASAGLCRILLDAVCNHVKLSGTSRYDTSKLTTDPYEFGAAHLTLHVAFRSHLTLARKLQNYGYAFSKYSSISNTNIFQVAY